MCRTDEATAADLAKRRVPGRCNVGDAACVYGLVYSSISACSTSARSFSI